MVGPFTPIPKPDIVLREEFDDWAILFDPDTAAAVGVNPVGVRTWKLIDGKRSLADIIEALRDQFDSVPDTVADDVAAFVKSLREYGFVGRELSDARDDR
jgi:SynChlorMet cassette protein ScmD